MQAHACAQRKVVLALKRFMGLGDASCPGGGVAGGLGRKVRAWAGGLVAGGLGRKVGAWAGGLVAGCLGRKAGGLGFAPLQVGFMKGILGGGIIAGIPGGLL